MCGNIGVNLAECDVTKNVPCITDPDSNTAECFISYGLVPECKAKNVACQQGYKEPCSGRSLSSCVQTGAACVLEKTNTTDCIFDTSSSFHLCLPTNADCRPGYKAICTSCPATGVSCISDDQGPGPTIPVYDPTCNSGTGYYGYSGVKSALGCLPTDPQTFINTATPWAVGIGAGIAFLLGLYGALMIVISAGDPEKMQAGKEIITSAIAGLLLIIFAVFILRIIGVDVLKLF